MILDDIVAKRKEQLAAEKKALPIEQLRERLAAAPRSCNSLREALRQPQIAVLAEVKRASPSKGLIRPDFDPVSIAKDYEAAGANAISVLTENFYFQGCGTFLQRIRERVSLPLLRKDFLFDPYQLEEAKLLGADAVLLIAALLPRETLREFSSLAASLGLECLVEVHNERELTVAVEEGFPIIGINNRDLTTFEVRLETTQKLAPLIPKDRVLVAESGVKDNADLRFLRSCGADAVLVGETLMRSGDVGSALRALREGV